MKKLLLAVLTVILVSCSSEDDNLQISENRVAETTQLANVTPVYLGNGFIQKIKGKSYAKVQWYSEYGFPNAVYIPHYVTIKVNGEIKADNYNEQFNRFSMPVSNTTNQIEFEIIQTVLGLGVSESVFVTVYRN